MKSLSHDHGRLAVGYVARLVFVYVVSISLYELDVAVAACSSFAFPLVILG